MLHVLLLNNGLNQCGCAEIEPAVDDGRYAIMTAVVNMSLPIDDVSSPSVPPILTRMATK